MLHALGQGRDRTFRTTGSCVLLAVVLALAFRTASCSLPSAECVPCAKKCPGDLECQDGLCISPGDPDACNKPVTAPGGLGGASGGTGGSVGSGTAGAPAATGADYCEQERPACRPEIRTGLAFDAICSGDELRVELDAGCECDDADAHHSVVWSAKGLPAEMKLEANTLVGTPSKSQLVSLTVDVDGHPTSDDFEITVLDRCLVFFATAESEAGPPLLAAARVDTGDSVALPSDASAAAALVSFDVSPTGKYLAEVVDVDDRNVLQLFELGATSVKPLLFQHPDNHVAHAFSPDSHWLVLVTQIAAEPAEQQIQLFDLTAGLALTDTKAIDYQGGLTWSDAGGALYRATHGAYFVARERAVGATDFGAEREYFETRPRTDEQFYRFLVGERGFMMLNAIGQPYLDRHSGEVVPYQSLEAVSPDLRWVAQLDGRLSITPLGTPVSSEAPNPPACDLLRAWSSKGSKVLCSASGESIVYEVMEDGALDRTDLNGSFDGRQKRVAFSDDGRWLALTPGEEGLVVLSETELASRPLDDATLAPTRLGKNEWDYFFTPDGSRLVVQRGRDLLSASLDGKTEIGPDDFTDLKVTLPEVPLCNMGWAPEPELWCGAPRFRGKLRLSPYGEHVAFTDDEGVVRVAALDASTVVRVGRAFDLPFGESIVFQ